MTAQDLTHDQQYKIQAPDDVSKLISKLAGQGKTNKVIWLALIGVFIDAYDLTTLSFGIEQVIAEFSLLRHNKFHHITKGLMRQNISQVKAIYIGFCDPFL